MMASPSRKNFLRSILAEQLFNRIIKIQAEVDRGFNPFSIKVRVSRVESRTSALKQPQCADAIPRVAALPGRRNS